MLLTIYIAAHIFTFIWSLWVIFFMWKEGNTQRRIFTLCMGIFSEIMIIRLILEFGYTIYQFIKERNPSKVSPNFNYITSGTVDVAESNDLYMLFDGTWKRVNDPLGETNISKLYNRLNDGSRHIHHIRGIGTFWYERYFFSWFGLGMVGRVVTAYKITQRHLQKYPDAKLYVMGFSRGAFTARSFVGMLSYVGILKPSVSASRAFLAYRFKMNTDSFTKIEPNVKFLGLFDTVSALGVPFFDALNEEAFGFHDYTMCDCVEKAVHLLSIHELRANFNYVGFKESSRLVTISMNGDHSDIGGGHNYDNVRGEISLDVMIKYLSESMGEAFKLDVNSLKLIDAHAFNHARRHFNHAFYGLNYLTSTPTKRKLPEYSVFWEEIEQ